MFIVPKLSQQRRAFLRNQIIQAATAAFAEQGYELLSMRSLASELGCAPGTLYLYFANKYDLVLAVVEESFSGLLNTLQAVPASGDPLLSLKSILRAYIDFGLRNPQHYKCSFLLTAGRPRKRTKKPHAAFQELRDRVRRCSEAGISGMAEIELTSQVLWACVHGITSLLIAKPDFPWLERNKLIDELVETALAGITRERGAFQHGTR
jgi:AcrR family transcriptional regulator